MDILNNIPVSNPNEGKVVEFTNITDSDFTHAFGGQPYFIKARSTVMLPYHLAKHLAKHLARKIFISQDKSATRYMPNDETGGAGKTLYTAEEEQEMVNTILGNTYDQGRSTPKTEMELLNERVKQLEKEFSTQIQESTQNFREKQDVMDELTKLGIKYNPRETKAKLTEILNEHKASLVTKDLTV